MYPRPAVFCNDCYSKFNNYKNKNKARFSQMFPRVVAVAPIAIDPVPAAEEHVADDLDNGAAALDL